MTVRSFSGYHYKVMDVWYDAGICYMTGKNCIQSYEKAIYCFKRAARYGSKDAKDRLKELKVY